MLAHLPARRPAVTQSPARCPSPPRPSPPGIPAHESTAWTLGWSWLLVFLNASTVALAATALFRLPGLAIGAAALLSVCTALVMPLCNSFLQVRLGRGACLDACTFVTCVVTGTQSNASQPPAPPSCPAALLAERHRLQPDPTCREHCFCR